MGVRAMVVTVLHRHRRDARRLQLGRRRFRGSRLRPLGESLIDREAGLDATAYRRECGLVRPTTYGAQPGKGLVVRDGYGNPAVRLDGRIDAVRHDVFGTVADRRRAT